MKLYLDGHELRYPAEQIAICVFPDEVHKFVTERPIRGDYAVFSFTENLHIITAECRLSRNGRLSVGAYETARVCDTLEYTRRASQAIRVAFYKAATEFLAAEPPWGALTGIRPAKIAVKLLKQGKTEDETDKALKNEYFVSQAKRRLLIEVARTGLAFEERRSPRDVSLYIGIPFCATRCKYCSFVSHSIDRAGHLILPYLNTLFYELGCFSKIISDINLRIKSVYIGGGTPTALSNKQLDGLMSYVAENFNLDEVEEYTVEAGRPDTADIEKIQTLKSRGATRISINPQTMNDDILAAMGRNHTGADIVRMVRDAREVGGLFINMDLIAGLPGDTYESFTDSLQRVIGLSPDNITVHTLAIKKGSYLKAAGESVPDGAVTAKMVDYATESIIKAGFMPYYLYRQKYISGNLENIGYAKRNRICAYNIYIMNELHSILSAGAGGVTKLVSRDGRRIERLFNPKYPYEYNKSKEKLDGNCDKAVDFFKRFL